MAPNVSYAEQFGNGTHYKAAVKYTCHPGRKTAQGQVAIIIHCQADSTWSEDEISCERMGLILLLLLFNSKECLVNIQYCMIIKTEKESKSSH